MGNIILYDSQEAAERVNGISGWIDRHGRFFGENEHAARYSGCTHIKCKECAEPTPVRGYAICDSCRTKKDVERYYAMPRVKWDGETPVYSDACDVYFSDEDELRDYLQEHDCTIDSLRLILCKENKYPEIEDDYFSEVLPDDIDDLPEELQTALDELNKVIRWLPAASWSPGKYAVECDL